MVLLLLPPPMSAQMPWNLMFDGQITPVLKCSKSIAIFAPKNHKLWVSRVPALRFPTNEPLPNPTDPNSHWENLLGCLGSKFWDDLKCNRCTVPTDPTVPRPMSKVFSACSSLQDRNREATCSVQPSHGLFFETTNLRASFANESQPSQHSTFWFCEGAFVVCQRAQKLGLQCLDTQVPGNVKKMVQLLN